jgi:hypothetical protein
LTGNIIPLKVLPPKKPYHWPLNYLKYVFAYIYKDLKGIPPKLVQHVIELDTPIPPAQQTRYILNP